MANRNCRLEFGCTPRYISKETLRTPRTRLEILLRNWLAGSKTVVSFSRDATVARGTRMNPVFLVYSKKITPYLHHFSFPFLDSSARTPATIAHEIIMFLCRSID